MKHFKSVAVTFLIALACSCTAQSQDHEVKGGQRVSSPDGIFTVEYTDSGGLIPGVDGLIIKNNQTGKAYPPVEINLLHPVQWTGDSQSISTISPIAGGNVAGVLRQKGGEWVGYAADPGIGDAYSVTRAVVGEHTLELTYVIQERHMGNSPAKFYTYSFVFHPDTASRTEEKTTAIDADTYRRLRSTFSNK